jgi:DNA-3-methyladenine glycosylase I
MFCSNCGVKIKQEHKFCFSCGTQLELSYPEKETRKKSLKARKSNLERGIGHDVSVIEKLKKVDLKDIFYKMQAAIKEECTLSEEQFEKNWGKFKKYHYKNYSDNGIYWILVQVAFYSGMKASIVTEKLPAIKKYFNDFNKAKGFSELEVNMILRDPNTIHYKRKIEACINNAITFDKLIRRYGTFANYIESFGNLQDDRNLELLKKDLIQFDYVGPITAYHVMLDLGLNVWKPDRVICRILFRLGLTNDEDNIEQAIMAGKEFARQLKEPIRYIDIVMAKYGQIGDEKGFGLPNGGICLKKNPRCHLCGVNEHCTFDAKNLS